MVLTQTNGPVLYATLTQTPAGYAAAVDIGVNLKTDPAAKPAVSAGGVVNAASFQAGMAQGYWVSIFGQNLAAATRSLTQADLVNGNLPTTLGGVSVQVDAQSAYPVFVSPTQINALTPAGGAAGSANVTVTNSAGTSAQAPVEFCGVPAGVLRCRTVCGVGERQCGGETGRFHRTVRHRLRS